MKRNPESGRTHSRPQESRALASADQDARHLEAMPPGLQPWGPDSRGCAPLRESGPGHSWPEMRPGTPEPGVLGLAGQGGGTGARGHLLPPGPRPPPSDSKQAAESMSPGSGPRGRDSHAKVGWGLRTSGKRVGRKLGASWANPVPPWSPDPASPHPTVSLRVPLKVHANNCWPIQNQLKHHLLQEAFSVLLRGPS